MKLDFFGHNWDLALRNNAVLLATNVFLTLALVVTSFLALTNRERIVLVPPRLDDKMLVAWSNAGAEYYKAFGLFVATLLGNITPSNSKFVADQLSVFINPKLYAPIRTQILAYADDPRFARAAAFNYFSPSKVVWEPATSKVFVMGTITMSSFNPGISGPYEYRPVIYELKFEMNDGKPLITEFASYQGVEPHTLGWIEANKVLLDREAAKAKEREASAINPAETVPDGKAEPKPDAGANVVVPPAAIAGSGPTSPVPSATGAAAPTPAVAPNPAVTTPASAPPAAPGLGAAPPPVMSPPASSPATSAKGP